MFQRFSPAINQLPAWMQANHTTKIDKTSSDMRMQVINSLKIKINNAGSLAIFFMELWTMLNNSVIIQYSFYLTS